MNGWTTRGMVLSIVLAAAACLSAASDLGVREYTAVKDDVAGNVTIFGQLIVHRTYEVPLGETIRKMPVFSLQYAGPHYRQGPANEPNHVEARAICVAEHLAHAWSLMDHGAGLEVLSDDWNVQRVRPQAGPATRLAVFVQDAAAGIGPLRLVTVYPEDLAGYPWITSEQSLAEYWAALIQAHHLLFWRCESDIRRYDSLRIGRTREGKVFRDTALRALALARSRGQSGFDAATLTEALAGLSLAQRQTLCRLATTPPVDWESSR